jgi:hypothetical protein
MASFTTPDGRRWCISHNPDPRAKQDAITKGGAAKARKERKVMPPDSPDPDWSTPKALRAWAEQRAGAIERGELDKKVIPQELARLARETHEVEKLEELSAEIGAIKQALRDRAEGRA